LASACDEMSKAHRLPTGVCPSERMAFWQMSYKPEELARDYGYTRRPSRSVSRWTI
jgi:hypothetical protein